MEHIGKKIDDTVYEIKEYKENQAPIDYVLGLNYSYDNKDREEQIIDVIMKDPSIIKH